MLDLNQFYLIFSYIVVGILGLLLGSFYNVVIYRIPNGLKIYKPARSFCPNCKNQIAWYDNIPVFSYVFLLKGKCRHCKQHISFRYTIVEILTCLLFLAVWWRFFDINRLSTIYTCVLYFIIVSIAEIMAFIDWEHFEAYDIMSFTLFACGLLLCFASDEVTFVELKQRAAGAIFALVFWGLYALIPSLIKKQETTGSGDIVAFTFCGFIVGIQGAVFMVITSWVFFILTFLVRKLIYRKKEFSVPLSKEEEEQKEFEKNAIPLLPGGMTSFFIAIMLAPQLYSICREFTFLLESIF